MATTASKLAELHKYSACDVSDALLKLKSPGAGFLADIGERYGREEMEQADETQLTKAPDAVPISSSHKQEKQIAPASTVLFVEKGVGNIDKNSSQGSSSGSSSSGISNVSKGNIPADAHYVDLTTPDTVVVMSQPKGQTNAVLGGIMAVRMKVLGAKGVVVDGRVRDLEELSGVGLPIYARGTSTVGAGAASIPFAIDVPVDINGVNVYPGDLIFADPKEGVVCIPQDKLEDVLRILPSIVAADERVLEVVKAGMEVWEAFRRFRS
ncbi:hypothetical protein FGG08_006380 [Glutinoglossum americanum]|uniref:Uncharacterized protein n=1 Tax=Glutinoglossum americanum TaxID=1670608 RepID=A0A9P8L0F8_9PEZI|nr:hypothetical protein FGG08_006380 [Glutinoglossum americanum]